MCQRTLKTGLADEFPNRSHKIRATREFIKYPPGVICERITGRTWTPPRGGRRGRVLWNYRASVTTQLLLEGGIKDIDGVFVDGGCTTALLTGNLLDGTRIEGSDSICIVP